MSRVRFAIIVMALPLLAFVAGCSSNNKGKIEGTKWTGEATTLKGNAIPAGMLSFEFSADGRVTQKIGPITSTGTYSLGMGNTVTWKLDNEKGQKYKSNFIIEGDRLTVQDPDGTTLKFTRAK